MSTYKSLKNIIPKRKYRERTQPEWRKNKGFLEKKQDYVKRARKYHKNQKQLNNLKVKARLANPEEFHHKMINMGMKDGELVRFDRKDPTFDEKEYRKILKTQNQNMVKYQKYRLSKKIEKLKPELLMLTGPKLNKEVLLVDNEQELNSIKTLKDFYKKSKLNKNKLGKRGRSGLDKIQEYQMTEEELKRGIQGKKRAYRKFANILLKEKELENYYIRIDQEKQLLSDGRKKKRHNKAGSVYIKKFKQRKR